MQRNRTPKNTMERHGSNRCLFGAYSIISFKRCAYDVFYAFSKVLIAVKSIDTVELQNFKSFFDSFYFAYGQWHPVRITVHDSKMFFAWRKIHGVTA